MATEPALRRFSVDEYHQMAAMGLLSEDDRVELIDGAIIEMSPIGSRHIACIINLNQLLTSYLGASAFVSIQNPVRLGPYQEPEPDVAVLRRRSYGDDPPSAPDVLLLMEVADTSLGFDRSRKLPLYAAVEIPEVWLVDIPGEAIERHTNPIAGTYGEIIRVGRGGAIQSIALPGVQLKTDDVFA